MNETSRQPVASGHDAVSSLGFSRGHSPTRRGSQAVTLTAVGLLFLLAVTVVASLAWGARYIPFADVVSALFGQGSSDVVGIVGELRVNRTVLGLACGAALGVAGVLVQGLTRNPVADPGILGVNAGASLGVVLAVTVTGSASLNLSVWSAVLGAGLATGAVMLVAASTARGSRSRSGVGADAVHLLLCGVALAAVLSGLTHALTLLDEQVGEHYRAWQVGSLTVRAPSEVLSTLPLLITGALIAWLMAGWLDALSLGDDLAHGLGVRPAWARTVGLVATALLAGTATALAGPVSFIGLVVPHLLRPLVGSGHRRLLPLSALGGAILLLAADIAGRFLGAGSELQVGVVTALVGAPLLAFFVVARRSGR